MTFLAPAAAIFLLALPVIVLYHFMRIRRQEVVLATNFLWQQALMERQVRRPWRRFRTSLLLALQLLAALLAAVAIMRPATATASGVAPNTVVIIEASASMQATDVSPSRFDAARQRVRSMIDSMGDGDRITLIAMTAHPTVLAQSTGDPEPLRTALNAANPDNGSPDVDGALALAAAIDSAPGSVNVVVVGDGLMAAPSVRTSQPFPVSFVKVGAAGDNVAITLLQATATGATATISNWGGTEQSEKVKLEADGALTDVQPVTVPPHSSRDVSLSAPVATSLHASLVGADALGLDNDAYATVPPQHKRVIQLITTRNIFLQTALQLRSDVTVSTVLPTAYSAATVVDLDIFDGFVPSALPTVPYMLVNPPEGQAASGKTLAPKQIAAHSLDDPILADVDLGTVHVAATHDLTHAPGIPVIDSDAGPLLLTQAQPRMAVLGFDIHNSDLPVKPAFPLLISHLSQFLLPQLTDRGRHTPDTPVSIATVAGATTVTVTDPHGQSVNVPVSNGIAVAINTDSAGVYALAEQGGGSSAAGSFAVSGTALTSLLPRDLPSLSALQPVAATGSHWVDRWQWLVLGLLLVLSLEWMVFHRG